MLQLRAPWKGTMTARERFYKQMHHQPTDRCFNMEFGYWEENFSLWPIFVQNSILNDHMANIALGFDRMEAIATHWMHPLFEERLVEQKDGRNIHVDEFGVFYESPTDGHSTIPRFLHASVRNPEEWYRLKSERFRREDPARRMPVADILAAHPDSRDYPLGVHCGSMIGMIRDMLTFEGLCYAIYDYPEMIEDMVEVSCVLIEDFLDQVLPHIQFDYASGWEDICFKNGPIVPVKFFRDVLLPRYQRINAKLKAYGIDIWYTDCDGDVRPLIPYFLEGGINCLFPYEVNSCLFPGDLLEQYPEMHIMGGVDKMQLIAGKTAIRDYLNRLAPYVKKGGLIPFCDHRCPPDVSEENYLYYLDYKQELFG